MIVFLPQVYLDYNIILEIYNDGYSTDLKYLVLHLYENSLETRRHSPPFSDKL
jgi:hypothetical protein